MRIAALCRWVTELLVLAVGLDFEHSFSGLAKLNGTCILSQASATSIHETGFERYEAFLWDRDSVEY